HQAGQARWSQIGRTGGVGDDVDETDGPFQGQLILLGALTARAGKVAVDPPQQGQELAAPDVVELFAQQWAQFHQPVQHHQPGADVVQVEPGGGVLHECFELPQHQAVHRVPQATDQVQGGAHADIVGI